MTRQWLLALLLLTAVPSASGWLVAQAPPKIGGSGGDEIVATIGDRVIRMRDLERFWREEEPASFFQLYQQVYDADRRLLDRLIGNYLLQNEASRRGIPVEQLLRVELPNRMPAVTEADILAVYSRSRAQVEGAPLEAMRPSIIQFLEQQRPSEARRRYVEELRKAAAEVTIRLDPPRQSVQVAASDPTVGPASAPVEMVEFGDFQ